MNKKSKTIISCLMAVMCISETQTCIVQAQDNDTFESYNTVSNLEINGKYSLNYVLKNYNAFVENNYNGQHVVGPVICGGEFTGYLGGCTSGGAINRYSHQVASFVADTTRNLTVNSFNNDLNFYMSQAAKDSKFLIDNTAVKYVDQFVDFEKAMASFSSEAQSLAKDAIKVDVTKPTDDYRYIDDWAKSIQVQSGKTYDISGITCAKTIDVRNTESGGDIIIYSDDEEVQMPRTFYNGAQIMPSEVGNGTGIVYLFPNAKKVTGADYSKVGHIVAPNATVNMGTGDYNGCVIAKEFNTASEGHSWSYNGQKIPNPDQEIHEATEESLEEPTWETVEEIEPFEPESVTITPETVESELIDPDEVVITEPITINVPEIEETEWETVEEIEPFEPEVVTPITINVPEIEEIVTETTEDMEIIEPAPETSLVINIPATNNIDMETAENFATENVEAIEWETAEEIEPFEPEAVTPITINVPVVEEIVTETTEDMEIIEPAPETALVINIPATNNIDMETAENFATENVEAIEWETTGDLEPFEPEVVEPIIINIPEIEEIEEIDMETVGDLEPFEPEVVIPEEVTPDVVEPEIVEPEVVEPITINVPEIEEIEWETADDLEPFEPEVVTPITINIPEIEETEWETAENFATENVEAIEWETAGDLEPFEPEVVIPEEVTPEIVEPEAVIPEEVTPEIIEPEVVIPEEVTPEIIEPEVVIPEEVTPEIIEPEIVFPEVPTSGKQETTKPKKVTPEDTAIEIIEPELPETGNSSEDTKESPVTIEPATPKENQTTTKATLPQTGTAQMNMIHVVATIFTLLSAAFLFKSKK